MSFFYMLQENISFNPLLSRNFSVVIVMDPNPIFITKINVFDWYVRIYIYNIVMD